METSKNERAEKLVGKRIIKGIAIDFPFEHWRRMI